MLDSIVKTAMDIIVPQKTKTIQANEPPPWMNCKLKQLILSRQKALSDGDLVQYRKLRNRVNRERKSCRTRFYETRVEHMKETKPSSWWSKVKKLGGMTNASGSQDPASLYQNIVNSQDTASCLESIANTINRVFLALMSDFQPLTVNSLPHLPPLEEYTLQVSELSVLRKLSNLNPNKACGPDGVPGWMLKENADLLAQPVADILNCSYKETRLPQSWKDADIAPIPKQNPILEVNKHLRTISLTPVLSMLAEDYVVDQHLKPAVLRKVDGNQFGVETFALISMLHSWLSATDGNGATIRTILFDFRKAFDFIDHKTLLRKLMTYDLPNTIVAWMIDFLTSRRQRVKLSQDCYLEWGAIPSGVPQGTKLGPWLFTIMINDLSITGIDMWKYVDDTTIANL